ncbi:MAG TPA: pseudouridine-5'-phosphate glycosidase [Kofleriaceae bacterium]|jgi:pseudouridine-5'-phosphate glycosidase
MLDLLFSPEVAEARVVGKPVVALESTLVAHGLPWPDNLDVARELEGAVRELGAVPATIAVLDGHARVGLDGDQLQKLARAGTTLAKAGATDLAVHLARKSSAATTVSGTALIAARAGVRVFATGGIGGVHRGDGGDVSHDLVAIAKTPIAIVSAGAKAILDLPRTAELLETLGVLVVGYRTDELPAFYTQRSGVRLEHFAADVQELATIARRHWDDLGGGGILVCNPIPSDAALDTPAIEAAIEAAIAEAEARGISGKRLTPHLLARVAEVTGGDSIRANRVLARHNAELAAELAIALL